MKIEKLENPIVINGAVITPEMANEIKFIQDDQNSLSKKYRDHIADMICMIIQKLDDGNGDKLIRQEMAKLIDLTYLRELFSCFEIPE